MTRLYHMYLMPNVEGHCVIVRDVFYKVLRARVSDYVGKMVVVAQRL